MQVNNYNSHQQNFKANKIATARNFVKNKGTCLDVYELTSKDVDFVTALRKRINLHELAPKLSDEDVFIWRQIFGLATNEISTKKKKTLLVMTQNKPCGIMKYTQNENNFFVDAVCTWPTEPDKKAPLAGKTLFNMLFNDFLKSDASRIDLTAVTNSPFNPVSKYMSLGFFQRGGENNLLAMRMFRDGVAKTTEKLKDMITISEDIVKDVDLMKITQ